MILNLQLLTAVLAAWRIRVVEQCLRRPVVGSFLAS